MTDGILHHSYGFLWFKYSMFQLPPFFLQAINGPQNDGNTNEEGLIFMTEVLEGPVIRSGEVFEKFEERKEKAGPVGAAIAPDGKPQASKSQPGTAAGVRVSKGDYIFWK